MRRRFLMFSLDGHKQPLRTQFSSMASIDTGLKGMKDKELVVKKLEHGIYVILPLSKSKV